MSTPNGGLITETNRQYYAGAQQFYISTVGSDKTFTSTFNTNLAFGDSDPATIGYNLNNFKIYTSANAQVWEELTPSNNQETGIVENATGGASLIVDLTVYNANIIAGMAVSGNGVSAGTTVASIVNPGTSITGLAFISSIAGYIGAIISPFSAQLTALVPTITVGMIIDDPLPPDNWTTYDPPSAVLLAGPIGNPAVTEISWSGSQTNTSIGQQLRFRPALTGTTTLTLTTYNAAILAGMGVSGNYIPSGTTVVSNTNNAGKSDIVLSKVMTRRPDNLDSYSFFTQELTLSKNATVVNTTVLTFKNVNVFTMSGNIVTVNVNLNAGTYLKIQLNENTLQQARGSYEYTRLVDIIDNFLIGYVGAGKLIPSAKRTDVIFHARRGLQEFSYDTLKSTRSQELTVNDALNIIIPQDYVNYVRLSWIDGLGVQHTIFPANTLTTNPYANPVQDNLGSPTQDSQDENVDGTSQTEAAWATNDPRRISGGFINDFANADILYNSLYDQALGQRYGLDPVTSQRNGWFTINEREGTFSFSSDLKSKLIVIEYVSDGNAYDLDMRIPKMAEEALYAHIIYSILSTSVGIQEYVVRRFKQERSAKLRNAKIRLSNLKSAEMIQTMRGQSKWLKY